MKRICLSIGVSRAQFLEPLPGAVTAAHEIGEWARGSGFDAVKVVTDEDPNRPVTTRRLREELQKLLVDKGEGIDTFVLHFSGHGCTRGAQENLWLPTDWKTDARVVAVEILRTKLYGHGIRNLTIFSDACRTLPDKIELTEVSLDGIIGLGPYDRVVPIIDRYSAAADGHQALMIPGATPAESRCVFSTVLVEALCGHSADAFDKHVLGKVTPESLGLFLRSRLTEIGVRYGMKCEPDVSPGIPRDHLIYYDSANPPVGDVPPPPKWPEPAPRATPDEVPTTTDMLLVESFRLETGGFYLEKSARSHPRRPRMRTRKIPKGQAASQFRRDFRLAAEDLRHAQSNLLIRGGGVSQVWASGSGKLPTIKSDATSARFQIETGSAEGTQILVEFDDGIFASAIIFPNLVTVVSRSETNEVGWMVLDRSSPIARQSRVTIEAIAKLGTGQLTARNADRLATALRRWKHVNPTLGALAAYLYDYTGDVDSIRRMAFFYASKGQPMPFDIAFMGLLPIDHAPHLSTVIVPPVSARARAGDADAEPGWVTDATPGTAGRIVGMWPIFRQGWAFLDDPEDVEEAAAARLQPLSRHLLPSPFTTFEADGGHEAVRTFELRGCL